MLKEYLKEEKPAQAIIFCNSKRNGALLFGKIASRFGAKKAIMVSQVLFLLVTGYAFRMESSTEFWVLGFVVALILGGSQAISRSLGLGGETQSMTIEEASAEWGEGAANDTMGSNSRVRAVRARAELGWAPGAPSLIEEIERGCYAA